MSFDLSSCGILLTVREHYYNKEALKYFYNTLRNRFLKRLELKSDKCY